MMKDKYNIIKKACKFKHRKIYLLVRKDNLEIIRMAWGENYKAAENYFDNWLSDNFVYVTMKDCFIVKVCKKSVK